MILEGVSISDLVDTIEYLLQRIAKSEDIIEEKHHIQPPAIASFNSEIARLRAILDQHIESNIP